MFKTIVIAAIAAFTTETQAVQIKSQAEIDAVVQNYLQAEEGSEAEWGFLKNIVNIDKFFDSGVKAWESNGSVGKDYPWWNLTKTNSI